MVIFSDLHAHNFLAYSEDRLGIMKNVLAEILQKARDTDKIVLFCGDITHKHGYIPTTVFLALHEVIASFPDVMIYAISGNHDHATKNYLTSVAVSSIDVFSKSLPNFKNIDFKITEIGGYHVVGVPYFHDNADFYRLLATVNTSPSIFEQPQKTILLAHQTPVGIFNSFIPADVDINHEYMQKFDYVFFGHIHRYQDFGNNRFMVGNPMVQDDSDIGNPKGYLELVDGVVTQHIIKTELDSTLLDAKKDFKVMSSEKKAVATIDPDFYSDNILDKYNAFCKAAALSESLINVGKTLIQ